MKKSLLIAIALLIAISMIWGDEGIQKIDGNTIRYINLAFERYIVAMKPKQKEIEAYVFEIRTEQHQVIVAISSKIYLLGGGAVLKIEKSTNGITEERYGE